MNQSVAIILFYSKKRTDGLRTRYIPLTVFINVAEIVITLSPIKLD